MVIKSIPTKYKGIQFRSILEARWAAFFDLIGWTKWAYEPIALSGWIPDFIIGPDLNNGVMVEVKPIDWSADKHVPGFNRGGPKVPELLTRELEAAQRVLPPKCRGLLLCGFAPYDNRRSANEVGIPAFTWTPGLFWDAGQSRWDAEKKQWDALPGLWSERWVHEDEATGELDVPLGGDPYIGMATGRSFKNADGFPGTDRMTRAWTEAGNITQYKPPR